MDKKRIIYLAVLLIAIGVLIYDQFGQKSDTDSPGINPPAPVTLTSGPASSQQQPPLPEPSPGQTPRGDFPLDSAPPLTIDESAPLSRDIFVPTALFLPPPPPPELVPDSERLKELQINWQLNGIIKRGGEYIAFINGSQPVFKGQWLGRWQVVDIGPESIQLQCNERTQELFVHTPLAPDQPVLIAIPND